MISMRKVFIFCLFVLISEHVNADAQESIQLKVMKEVSSSADSSASDTDPARILQQVQTAYQSLETYRAKGAITTHMDTKGVRQTIETDFTILLKKSNLYLISWKRKINLPSGGKIEQGTEWNDGSQPYSYLERMKAYTKLANDQNALLMTVGRSGISPLILSLFFPDMFKERLNLIEQLTNLEWQGMEKVGSKNCYVISAEAGKGSAMPGRLVFWITKSDYWIAKYFFMSETSSRENLEITDQQIEEDFPTFFGAKGPGHTPEDKQKMKEDIRKIRGRAGKAGKTKISYTETYTQISSPDLTPSDFQFKPPADAVLKESLFETPKKAP